MELRQPEPRDMTDGIAVIDEPLDQRQAANVLRRIETRSSLGSNRLHHRIAALPDPQGIGRNPCQTRDGSDAIGLRGEWMLRFSQSDTFYEQTLSIKKRI